MTLVKLAEFEPARARLAPIFFSASADNASDLLILRLQNTPKRKAAL